jgi:hypothetical protein
MVCETPDWELIFEPGKLNDLPLKPISQILDTYQCFKAFYTAYNKGLTINMLGKLTDSF